MDWARTTTSCTREVILDEPKEQLYFNYSRDSSDNYCKVLVKNRVPDTELCVKQIHSGIRYSTCLQRFELTLVDPNMLSFVTNKHALVKNTTMIFSLAQNTYT